MTTAAARPSLSMPPHDHAPRPYSGPSKQEVLAIRKQYCHPSTFLYYRDPLMLVEGHMQYLWDETGRRYLDGFAGIVTVSCGHCHPRFVERVQAQVGGHPAHDHDLPASRTPAVGAEAGREDAARDSTVTYFINSGSEANELAVLMARPTPATRRHRLRNGYHGGHPAAMGLTSHAHLEVPAARSSQGVQHAIAPICYRCPFTGTPEEIAYLERRATSAT